MRYFPSESDWDQNRIKELHVEPWMVNLLRCNPGYNSWGPGEDYMPSPSKNGGWGSSLEYKDWQEFGPWEPDELNELVNFYFELNNDGCGQPGYVSLILWFLHPRKGASRGVIVRKIEQSELSSIKKFLKVAR